MNLVESGELSHAARILRSSGLAPGNAQTLQELSNPELRPQERLDDLPPEAINYQPAVPLRLDRDLFARTPQQARKGLSAGLGGTRNEYLKLCLEDNDSLD